MWDEPVPDNLLHLPAHLPMTQATTAPLVLHMPAPSASELKNKPIARKSLVAACHIRAGERFSADNLAAKRPGTGISPMQWDAVIGRVAVRDFQADELIEL